MTTARRRVPLMFAALFLASSAACAANPTAPPTPTPTTPPKPACPVGSWTSTGVTANTAAGAAVNFDGGSGVKVTIGDDGKVKADFSGMKPVTVSGQVLTAQIRGEITYAGTTDGTVDFKGSAPATTSTTGQATGSLPTGAATPGGTPTRGATATTAPPTQASGKSGAWRPTGTVNVNDLKITVKLAQPVAATILNNVKVSDVTGSQTAQVGDAVDLQPLLRAGTYQCSGEDSMVITTSAKAPTLVWSLTRM